MPVTLFSWKGFPHDVLNGMRWCLFTLLSLNTREPHYQSSHSEKAPKTTEVISSCTFLLQRWIFDSFELMHADAISGTVQNRDKQPIILQHHVNHGSGSLLLLQWGSRKENFHPSPHGITVFVKGKKQMTKCVPICVYAFMHVKLIMELIYRQDCLIREICYSPGWNLGAAGVNVSHSWLWKEKKLCYVETLHLSLSWEWIEATRIF